MIIGFQLVACVTHFFCRWLGWIPFYKMVNWQARFCVQMKNVKESLGIIIGQVLCVAAKNGSLQVSALQG